MQNTKTAAIKKQTTIHRNNESKTSSLFSILGSSSEDYIIGIIRNGIPKKMMDELMMETGITPAEMADYIRTSDRTLRRYNHNTILNKEQSERVLELAMLYEKGKEVFESMNAFKEWMNAPLMASGNKKPKQYLDTSIGITKLIHILGRIEHGVYS